LAAKKDLRGADATAQAGDTIADETEAKPKRGPGQAPGGGGARGPGQGKADGAANRPNEPAAPKVIEIRPMAKPSKMRARHWGILVSLLLMVVLPIGGAAWYLWGRAVDEYASTTGFTVRSEDSNASMAMMGGITSLIGGSTSGDADVIYEYIQSQDMVTKVDAALDLRSHYSAPFNQDPYFALNPDSTVEDLLSYWQRIVRVAYNQSTGLLSIEVRAFSPDMAQRVAEEIVSQSQVLVNELNATARADQLKYAQQDLDDSLVRLKSAREALVNFRMRTQIVDPQSDLQGRMGVLNSLQQQLAQALIDHDLIAQEAAPGDPRILQANRRIEVIRSRINDERTNFSSNDRQADGLEAYPELLAEYESLTVDNQFAEETYRVALTALDVARANVARQTRYLASYLRPTLPQSAEYPQRWTSLGVAGLFLFMIWAILSLSFYSLRDRR